MSAASVRRRYLLLHGLRWFPVGLMVPVLVLLPLGRGLTLAEIGVVAAMQGLVVLFLELPTGGLADALGRRPVLIAAQVIGIASIAVMTVAHSVALFAVVFLLQGVYRALDSGPLASWYVDASLAEDPKADIETGLSRGGVVIGLAIAGGALLSGVLVGTHPVPGMERVLLPVLVSLVIQVVSLVATALLMTENRRGAGGRGAVLASVRAVPGVIRTAGGLVRRSRVLLALVSVELLWGFGMVTFETLFPVRLSEVAGGVDDAAALLGPTGAAAWLASAGGAALVQVAARRIGAQWTGAALHVLQALTVVAMALLAGPVGVITAYLVCYAAHGAANPVYAGLLHRQVDGDHRTTVLSMASMMSQPAGAAGMVTLTALATATSVPVAMLVGSVVLALAAPLYLVGPRPGTAPEPGPAIAT